MGPSIVNFMSQGPIVQNLINGAPNWGQPVKMKFVTLIGLALAGGAPAPFDPNRVGHASVPPPLDKATAISVLDQIHKATDPVDGPKLVGLIRSFNAQFPINADTLINLVNTATSTDPKSTKKSTTLQSLQKRQGDTCKANATRRRY